MSKKVNYSVMDVEQLKGIAASVEPKHREEKCKAFGRIFGSTSDAVKLAELAQERISAMKVWLKNWETLLAGLEPDLVEVREKQVSSELEAIGKMTENQRKQILAALQNEQKVA